MKNWLEVFDMQCSCWLDEVDSLLTDILHTDHNLQPRIEHCSRSICDQDIKRALVPINPILITSQDLPLTSIRPIHACTVSMKSRRKLRH